MIRGSSGRLTSFQTDWRAEILKAVESGSATYVVVADAPDYARGHLNGLLGQEILVKDFTSLGTAIATRYHLEQTIGAFSIYRVNSEVRL
jgi:hypothetical protein